ncbi:DMT family transporter [Kitasatospora camelliae]|uniref:DMT family transporter n=1 Tax=Kitasatospora camelliae TaxID=3156397 RepID=A0AAU8K2R9_9ACTN
MGESTFGEGCVAEGEGGWAGGEPHGGDGFDADASGLGGGHHGAFVVVQGAGSGDLPGFLFALGTLACEAAFSLVAVPLLPQLGPVRVSAYSTVLAVPMFAVAAAVQDGVHALRTPTGPELAALLYLGTALTCGAFLLWYGALGRLGPERAGLFAGPVPVTAALSGAVLGTGGLRPAELAGAALVGLGVRAGLTATRPAARPTPDHRPVTDGHPTPEPPDDRVPYGADSPHAGSSSAGNPLLTRGHDG